MSVVLTRRMLLVLLAGTFMCASATPGFARDGGGEGEGGDDGGGHDDGGHDDNGGDDGGGDDGGGDDKGGDDNGGDRDKKREDGALSQDEALRQRQNGRVIPLETALKIAGKKVSGRIIDIDLTMRHGRPQYQFKIRRDDGVIKTVRLDARTGKIIGLLGF